MKTKTKTTHAAAVLTIREAGRMTPAGRKAIAEWLRQNAKDLIKYGETAYGKTFVGRYLY